MKGKSKERVLVVGDDIPHRTMLRNLLTGWGYMIFEADDGSTAIKNNYEQAFDLILMDINDIETSSHEILAKIKVFNPAIPIIVMTPYSSRGIFPRAVINEVHDYLTKPLEFYDLRMKIEKVIGHIRIIEKDLISNEDLDSNFDKGNIIGRSPAIENVLKTVAKISQSSLTILITGESGTGKEMIAEAIHNNSPRKNGPFIKINYDALVETLIESELFSHKKYVFTGRRVKKVGQFFQANGGSIFF